MQEVTNADNFGFICSQNIFVLFLTFLVLLELKFTKGRVEKRWLLSKDARGDGTPYQRAGILTGTRSFVILENEWYGVSL